MYYRLHRGHVLHVVFNHDLEIDINLDSLGFVHLFPLRFLLLDVVHLLSPLFSVLLESLNLLKTRSLLGKWVIVRAVFQAGIIHKLNLGRCSTHIYS